MALRKNQSTLSAAEKTAFVEAVLAQKQRPSRLHPATADRTRYDDFVEVHLNAMAVMMQSPPAPSWGHMAAAFCPWHRALLLEFERELQTVDPAVTLPYWDWTVDRTKTASVWGADFLGGNGSDPDGQVSDGSFAGSGGRWPIVVKDDPGDPDFLRRRMGARSDARNPPTAARQTQVMDLTPYDTPPWEDMLRDQQNAADWGGFRFGLESPLHNLVHRWVGGNMLDMSSPNDPVFWLHHCNLDRLWSLWQFAHPAIAGYLPAAGGPVGHDAHDEMIFHAPGDPAPWDTVYHPIDVLDHRALGIAYDTDPAAAPPVMAPSALPEAVPSAGRVPVARRMTLPMFVLPHEIAALERTWP